MALLQLPIAGPFVCICCHQKGLRRKLHWVYELQVGKLFIERNIFVRHQYKICNHCEQKINENDEVRIPIKFVNSSDISPKNYHHVLQSVSKYINAKSKFDLYSNKNLKEMGTGWNWFNQCVSTDSRHWALSGGHGSKNFHLCGLTGPDLDLLQKDSKIKKREHLIMFLAIGFLFAETL